MPLLTLTAQRQYWMLMIQDLQPTHAVTLGYNPHRRGYTVTIDQVHRDLDHLHGLVDRKLYGPRYYKRQPARRTTYIGCIEHQHSNLHVHLAWRVPQVDKLLFEVEIAKIWRSSSPSATIDIVPIYDGWAAYITKDLGHNPDDDQRIIVGRHARS